MTDMRTIVISDAHGYPQLITAALEHSGFRQGVNRLIYAGDFLDRGSRAEECLEVLEDAGAEILWGNHEAAVLLGWPIWPQNEESQAFRSRLLRRFAAGDWQLVTCIDGVLVSHAGLSAAYGPDFILSGADPGALAARINQEFREEALRWLASGRGAEVPRVFGEFGPLWLRPAEMGPAGLLPCVVQIAGHTHLDDETAGELREAGLHSTDPGVGVGWEWLALPFWRYAVVRCGVVEIVREDRILRCAS